MSIFDDFINDDFGRIVISIIWGLGLATLFKKVCTGRNCIVIKSPDIDEINNNIYSFDGKCFKFKPKITTCKIKKN